MTIEEYLKTLHSMNVPFRPQYSTNSSHIDHSTTTPALVIPPQHEEVFLARAKDALNIEFTKVNHDIQTTTPHHYQTSPPNQNTFRLSPILPFHDTSNTESTTNYNDNNNAAQSGANHPQDPRFLNLRLLKNLGVQGSVPGGGSQGLGYDQHVAECLS
eukprot:6053837-Amphidinium_carterae.1